MKETISEGERPADRMYRSSIVESGWVEMRFGSDEMAYSPIRSYNTEFFFSLLDIFVLNTPFSSPRVSLRTSSEENTGLYSLPTPRSSSMALCVKVCWCLNESEGTQRQDGGLSSAKRALQGISLKSWIHRGPEWSRKPCPNLLGVSGCLHAALRRTGCLALSCVFLSVDLPCCGCCWEETLLPQR